jgi:hypothetical protein
MTPDDLDARLDDPCGVCERPFRWCECVRDDCSIEGSLYEGDVIGYLTAWSTGRGGGQGTVMRLWANYRRAQDGWRRPGGVA